MEIMSLFVAVVSWRRAKSTGLSLRYRDTVPASPDGRGEISSFIVIQTLVADYDVADEDRPAGGSDGYGLRVAPQVDA